MTELRTDDSSVAESRKIVETVLKDGKAHYGINTGFGILASKRISDQDLKNLQRNLILSHAVGVGNSIPKEISRLMLQLKIHALGQGFSGISVE
ncbi:MAG: aromatic amino acid lyase, partial [Bacteroidetes bacterium]|nr:aromatic amino acid lyase [Bacteroidota bacterium]